MDDYSPNDRPGAANLASAEETTADSADPGRGNGARTEDPAVGAGARGNEPARVHRSPGEPVREPGQRDRVDPPAAGPAARPESVTVTQGGIQTANADTVQVRQGGIARAEAKDIAVTMGGIALARGDRVSVELGAMGAGIGREVHLTQGAANLVLGQDVAVEQSLVQTVAAANVRFDRPSVVVFLLARRVEGSVRTLFDWRSAIAFGAAAGLVMSLLRRRR
jgi:hypothetical protein